ncbi:hypothetical protein EI77_01661 [Prosthecobacter fusiformis]|uniref:Uncharacterized protein n=1 Tax=Prosthecobacter fusiformis TaxID=48464 RepID=A0A4V3FG43_9BACT|nr:hypothetical protein [Prosthecobacter fusiformis]TDU73193.1 hypothetical protein EI77_01661 [Prosthecobacter fusiformis]
MRLTHFAQALTLILLCVTGYLAWEGQQEIKGLKKERDFERQQRLAEQTASPAQESLIPLPTAATSITPPPTPGTIASPEPRPEELMAGASTLPGGGLTVPKSVMEAEAQGISTNTLTPLQKMVLAAQPVAKIKTVVREQGFIIIDAGSAQGIAKGQKYEIRRANAVLGKVTVTDSVEATEAVADLDFASIPSGVTLEPGDELIAPVAR